MDLTQIFNLKKQFEKISISTEQELCRQRGILKRVQMPWQKKFETLFQYKEIYADRLRSIKSAFNLTSNMTIQDLSTDQNACQLVGLFKRIEAKRVRAFEPEYKEKYQNHRKIYSDKDLYELQDQTGKIKLQIRPSTKFNDSTSFKPLQTPYGVIVKCKGAYNPKINRYILSSVQSPGPAQQLPARLPRDSSTYMLAMCEPGIQDLQRMLDFLRSSSKNFGTKSSQLVIIGGLNFKDLNQIRQFDILVSEIGQIVDTFVVPSSGQQTSYIYPLNPVPKSLLQKSYSNENVGNCSNPQILSSKLNNVNLDTFVSCGQNLLNLKANCNIQDDIELMKMTVQYRHVCPSSVFSLPIQSYNYDPLVLRQTPHIMIHGKCQIYSTQFWQKSSPQGAKVQVRLVGLSKRDCVFINLSSKTFQTQKLQI